ncbi:MAG: hypothetical protein KC415_19045 [Anaerolineales bacterium]|nr:hypothetical protein [Anaerolineales bacterium]
MTDDKTLQLKLPLNHKFWRFFALTILGFSILRGIRYPNMWSYSHFLFNYDLGFVKRGLLGEAMTHLGSPFFVSYEFFVIFSSILFAINMLLLSMLIVDTVNGRNPILIGALLVFISSMAIVFLAHTIGYFDQIGLLLTLLTLRLRTFRKKMLFLVIAMPIALLIHEAILVIFFPVNFMSLLLTIGENGRVKKLALLTLFSAIILALVFTISKYTPDQSQTDQLYANLQANLDYPLRKDAFSVLHRDFAENFQRTINRWTPERLMELRQSVLVTVPSFLLFIYITALILKQASAKPTIILLAILASSSPLVLYFFGWDMHRWNTLTITTSFLMLTIVHNHAGQPAINVSHRIYFLFALMVFLNAISTITLFDGYYVKQFPFMEHQNYLLDLIRGIEKFPYIPSD